jgi:hypothetical protein
MTPTTNATLPTIAKALAIPYLLFSFEEFPAPFVFSTSLQLALQVHSS